MNQPMGDGLVFLPEVLFGFGGWPTIREASCAFWKEKICISRSFQRSVRGRTLVNVELVSSPNVAIGDANPSAQSVESVVDSLLRVSYLITNVEVPLDDNAWTRTSWSETWLLHNIVLASFLALKNNGILIPRTFGWFQIQILPWLEHSPVEFDNDDVPHAFPPTETFYPFSCKVSLCDAASWVHPGNRRNQPVA